MAKTSVQTWDDDDGEEMKVAPIRRRPKLGLTLVCLSGLAILWIPVNLYWLAFVPGSFAYAGILYGVLVLSCGILGWLMPKYVRILGVFAMIISIASIIGALGGMIIGTLLGVVGGALCISWSPEDVSTQATGTRDRRHNRDFNDMDDLEETIWDDVGKKKAEWNRWYR